MKSIAISRVRNEFDIIEAFVRHHAHHFEKLIILDDGSTDGTYEVLLSLQTAGLPLVLRGIQQQDWNDIALGIVLSLEQTENYERERGAEGTRDEWHDRSQGIKGATEKGSARWMPEDLVKLAEQSTRRKQ